MNSDRSEYLMRLNAIIDTAIDGIITIDEHGIIESVNPAILQIFGYAKEELLGQNISILMPSPHKENHDQYIRHYLRTKTPKVIGLGREVQGVKKSGEIFPIRLAINETKLTSKTIFTGIIHDMTKIVEEKKKRENLNKSLEKLVAKRTAELEEVITKLKNKEIELHKAISKERELNELKSRFVSMASHEFRTPLTSIMSSADLIQKYVYTEDQPKRERHTKRIKSSVNNLIAILDDVLSLTRLEEGRIQINIEEIYFDHLIADIVSGVNGLLKEGQNVKVEIDNHLPSFYFDQLILTNILFNILSNAIKYSKTDVIFRVDTTMDKIIFQIEDQGIGIPEADQKYLFQRFFRAENVANIKGTGLGLNIVKHYLEIVGGEIRFFSVLGQGTTFIIEIPNRKKYVNT